MATGKVGVEHSEKAGGPVPSAKALGLVDKEDVDQSSDRTLRLDLSLAENLTDKPVLSVVRAAIVLVLFYNLLFLALAKSEGLRQPVLILHSFDVVTSAFGFVLTYFALFKRFWRPATSFFCCTWAIVAAAIAAYTHRPDFLTYELVLLLAGTGALIPWGTAWQSAYALVALSCYAFVAPADVAGTTAVIQWLALLTAAGIAQCGVTLNSRHRRQIAAGVQGLREEAARREAVIAELERTHKQLTQSEIKLRKIFEATPDTICINSMVDGRFISVNSQFSSTGYTNDQTLGVSAQSHGIWADRQQYREFAKKLQARGIAHNFEADFRQKDGSIVPCIISGAVVEIDGEPCVVTITSNISKLKRAEQELIAARELALAASSAKSEFLSSMSHEIRTPMNAILGMADLLEECELTDEQRKYLEVMINNGNALLRLINDILDLAKVESGRLTLEKVEFDLDDLIGKTGEALAVRAHEKGLELVHRVLPDVATKLVGDPLRLRQILINLVGNAVKFTEKGWVIVKVAQESASQDQVSLHFSVTDTGIGIAPDQIENVFGDFTQADASTGRKYGGTGLGLAIVKRLVEMMGGRIWAESEVGRGTTFHFIANFGLGDRQNASTEEKADEQAALDLRGVRTLVVDDTAVNRLIVREALSTIGAEVGEADSGPSALQELEHAALSGRPYLLVILDCRMPGMDGIEVARRIRASNSSQKVIVVMLTSDDLNVQLNRAREAGVDAYLVKPIRRADLLAAIATALKEAQRKRTGTERRRRAQAPSNVSPDGPVMHVLVAEDSRDNRLLVEAYLKNTRYKPDMAENGEIAVTKFKAGEYHAVLMDISMPVMDGYAALRGIRQWEREQALPQTPVIALTAAAFPEHARKAEEAGFQLYVTKPVKKATVIDALEKVTGKPEAKGADSKEAGAPVQNVGSTAGGKIIVEADPDLYELTVDFVTHKRDDIKALVDAIEKRDIEAVRAIGHTLKGEGGGFGMDPISEIGAALEQAAKEKNEAVMRPLVRSLQDYLDRVQVVMQSESANGSTPAT